VFVESVGEEEKEKKGGGKEGRKKKKKKKKKKEREETEKKKKKKKNSTAKLHKKELDEELFALNQKKCGSSCSAGRSSSRCSTGY